MDWLTTDHSAEGLEALLSDDVTFFSPVVHTPQVGKKITMAYLLAAGNTIGNDTFRYMQELDCDEHAVLEFETEMAGIHVNGVDIIEWNSDGKIIKFKPTAPHWGWAQGWPTSGVLVGLHFMHVVAFQ